MIEFHFTERSCMSRLGSLFSAHAAFSPEIVDCLRGTRFDAALGNHQPLNDPNSKSVTSPRAKPASNKTALAHSSAGESTFSARPKSKKRPERSSPPSIVSI